MGPSSRSWEILLAATALLWGVAASGWAAPGVVTTASAASGQEGSRQDSEPGPASPETARHHLVAAAPGYPGSVEQAQPTMDAFAQMVAEAAGWEADALSAEYRPEEETGIAAIEQRATLALVPLPFYLAHEESLGLEPLVQTVPRQADAAVWSLVAAAGKVSSPADLAGWELVGIPAYAPQVVRGPILGHWGQLPDDVEPVFTDRVLSALRRALGGENVAVLLDAAQTAALDSLPGAEKLKVVTRSPSMPAAIVATVADRVPPEDAGRLRQGLLEVHRAERFAEVLDTLRLQRFEPVDGERLAQLRAETRDAR